MSLKTRSREVRVMDGSVGLYGDLQGIAGKTLQEIEGLELPALEAPDPTATNPKG